MFAVHGAFETKEDLGTKSKSRIADYPLVGQIGKSSISSILCLPISEEQMEKLVD